MGVGRRRGRGKGKERGKRGEFKGGGANLVEG